MPLFLLPLDGSAIAEQAIPYAVVQAERFRAELALLNVLELLTERLSESTRVIK